MNRFILTKDRQGRFGHHANGSTTIQFKRKLKHPIEKVWRAITNPDETAKWFPMLKELNLSTGGRVLMDFSGDDRSPTERIPDDTHVCEVTAFNPPYLLEYLGPKGGLRFELESRDDQCQLTLTAINHPDTGILYSVVCGWHFYAECLEWHLDEAEFDVAADMEASTHKLFDYYYKEQVPGFTG